MGSSYETVKKLGQGGFGRVYLVKKNNKLYALKKIEISKLFKQDKKEINILKSFDDENIVKYIDSFKEDDDLCIMMEYCGKNDLRKFIDEYRNENKFINEKIITDIVLQICSGIKTIHSKKIIHRDLKPGNILINEKNIIKIGDFGLSREIGSNSFASSKCGTHYYMAPEIIRYGKYNKKADIYSLGCIIYELLTLHYYYNDIVIGHQKVQIDKNEYNTNWEDLINLLTKMDYNQRPNINEVINYIYGNFYKSEIILKMQIDEKDINKNIFFLSKSNEDLKELDEINTEIYINGNKKAYERYFCPTAKGIYDIKIKLYFSITDCTNFFAYNRNVINIDLSSFDSNKAKTMEKMFYECANLKNINLSNFNTMKVENMKEMFRGCKNLERIDVSNLDTENVRNLDSMFNDCEKLKNIDLSNFSTKNVINMQYMFCRCENLKNVNLSSFYTENVTELSGLFAGCKKLENIDLSNFNTKNVTSLYNMFFFCENLKNVNLTSFNTKKVEMLSNMFRCCKSIESIDLTTFNTENVIDMSNMFSECYNLCKLDLSNFNIKKVKWMEKMFFRCYRLKDLKLFDVPFGKFTTYFQSLNLYENDHFGGMNALQYYFKNDNN